MVQLSCRWEVSHLLDMSVAFPALNDVCPKALGKSSSEVWPGMEQSSPCPGRLRGTKQSQLRF